MSSAASMLASWPALNHPQLRVSETSHILCSFVYVWCSSAFSWAGPRRIQHHTRRQILNELISEFCRRRHAVYCWWHTSHICVSEHVRSQESIQKMEPQLYKKCGTEVKVDNTSCCLVTRVSPPPFLLSTILNFYQIFVEIAILANYILRFPYITHPVPS